MGTGLWIVVWLAMQSQGPASTPPPRPPSAAAAATARALAAAIRTAARLAALRDGDVEEPGVVDSLQPELFEAELDRTLHRQIGDFVEGWLREHGTDGPPDQLAWEMTLELKWAAVCFGRDDDGERSKALSAELASNFDWDVKVAAVHPADDSDLLAISWETRLQFLGNSTLLVFSTAGGRVERLLKWSAELAGWPDGDSPGLQPLPFGPADVLNNFDLALSARDERGDFYVAAVWAEPSPSSSWGAVSWALLAPGSGPRSPRVLARGSVGAQGCSDRDCYRLALENGLVMLDYTGSPGELAVCNGFTSSDQQQTWRLVDGRAEELKIPSGLPFHFVSDWLAAPWRDARLWSAGGADLRRWHRLLKDVACQLERGREWVDACEATKREVLELVLRTSETSDPLFFVFDENDEMRLIDVTPRMPAGTWLTSDDCYVEGLHG